MSDHELDVRPLAKPDKHPAIFQAYAAVPVGESLELINDHDPRHLHDDHQRRQALTLLTTALDSTSR